MLSTDCQLQQPPTCAGVVSPADAGRGVFDGLSDSSAVAGVIGAGALVAALFFAYFLARFVGAFFRASRDLRDWRRVHPSGRRARSLEPVQRNNLDAPQARELDAEDDSEASDEDDHDEDSPGAPEKHQ